jgi:hypothetical protein
VPDWLVGISEVEMLAMVIVPAFGCCAEITSPDASLPQIA